MADRMDAARQRVVPMASASLAGMRLQRVQSGRPLHAGAAAATSQPGRKEAHHSSTSQVSSRACTITDTYSIDYKVGIVVMQGDREEGR